MTIGQKIRYFAERNLGGVTKLAEAFEVKLPTLYPYLNDKSLPGAQMLIKLHKLGCDINWLLSDDDDAIVKDSKIAYYNMDRIKSLEQEVKELRRAINQIKTIINQLGEQK